MTAQQFLVTIDAPDGSQIKQLVRVGMVHGINLPSAYLVSPGQDVSFGISVDEYIPPVPGSTLMNASTGVGVVPTYDMSYIPSTRTLADIMQDAVRHGITHPTHGSDCSCMDNYVRELRQHISKAMPPDTNYEEMTPEDRHARLDARDRIGGILHRLWRNL